MVQVRITEITGGTFPIQAFISDIYGNNQFLLGTISGVPPTVYYNTTIPTIFQTAPEIMLRLVDANGCESVKILDCTFGCTFNITVELESCVVNIDIQNAVCGFNIICT
jgi:hypothetical protein